MSDIVTTTMTREQAKVLLDAASRGLDEWACELDEPGWNPMGSREDYELASKAYMIMVHDTEVRA